MMDIDAACAQLADLRPKSDATERYGKLWALSAKLLSEYAYARGKAEGLSASVKELRAPEATT